LLSGLSRARLVCHTRRMDNPSITRYKNHRFPAEIISHAVWLYFRFCLSYRDVEELLFSRGVIVTYEAIRKWCRKFGQGYANQLRHRCLQPGDKWHLDEVFLTINCSCSQTVARGLANKRHFRPAFGANRPTCELTIPANEPTFRLFVVFGESQSAVPDLADGITRRPCAEPCCPVHSHQKWAMFIQPLICTAMSESSALYSQIMPPTATMTPRIWRGWRVAFDDTRLANLPEPHPPIG
jgi:hypothetical protein